MPKPTPHAALFCICSPDGKHHTTLAYSPYCVWCSAEILTPEEFDAAEVEDLRAVGRARRARLGGHHA